MQTTGSFQQILERKIGKKSAENETSYIKNYVPGRYDIPILGLKAANFASKIENSPYENSQILVTKPFIEPTQPQEPRVLVADFSALASVAFRTLSTLSAQGLGDSMSASELKSIKRKLSKKLHPDVGGNTEKFLSMLEAVRILNEEIDQLIESQNLTEDSAAA